VRELKHAIQHAVILAHGQPIEACHLPAEFRGQSESPRPSTIEPLALVMAQFEKEYVERVLRSTAGERARTAELLGISRKNLWEKMVKYGLK
jgi:DNA-binding NtrC family response regulator